MPCILARGLVRNGNMTLAAATSPLSISAWEYPTVAISGSVKTLLETARRSNGCTAWPSKCHMAIRPCIAATEASIITPVQSPAA